MASRGHVVVPSRELDSQFFNVVLFVCLIHRYCRVDYSVFLLVEALLREAQVVTWQTVRTDVANSAGRRRAQ
jgi:hypothetical protein